MKTLNQMLDGYKPKAGDEQKFKDKHVVVKSKLSKPTEDDQMFNATNVKTVKRAPHHGYDQGKDEEVYEAAEQTPPFEPSKSTFKKAKNPNRTPMDSVKALAQKGMKTKTNEELEQVDEMDKSQDPPGRDGGHQFPPGPKVSKKVIKAINKDPAKHLSDLFAKEHTKKKMKEEVEQVEEVRKMASGGRDNAGGQYYDIDNGDGTIGFGYKPGKSQPSSSHSNYEIKPESKHPLHGKLVTAKHSNGQEVTGRLMGTEHQGTVAKIKHSSGMIHSTDAKTVKKAISEMKEEVVAEAKDPKEYGYEGDMAMNQLQTIMRHAKYLMDMMKPDTDLPEWVQSKITLAADYIQTSCDYMTSEMNEASSPAQQAAIAINMKKKGIKPKNMKEEVEQIGEDMSKDVQKTKDGGYWSKGAKTATHYSGKKTYEWRKFDKEGKETGERHYRDAQGNYMGEETEPPFKADKPKQRVVPGKAGKGYSTARHLARMAMQKQVDKLKKPVKESLEESRKAQIVRDIVKKKKATTEDTFQKDPELSSSLTKTQ